MYAYVCRSYVYRSYVCRFVNTDIMSAYTSILCDLFSYQPAQQAVMYTYCKVFSLICVSHVKGYRFNPVDPVT